MIYQIGGFIRFVEKFSVLPAFLKKFIIIITRLNIQYKKILI